MGLYEDGWRCLGIDAFRAGCLMKRNASELRMAGGIASEVFSSDSVPCGLSSDCGVRRGGGIHFGGSQGDFGCSMEGYKR